MFLGIRSLKIENPSTVLNERLECFLGSVTLFPLMSRSIFELLMKSLRSAFVEVLLEIAQLDGLS